MTSDIARAKRLKDLEPQFEGIENASLVERECPMGKYPCFRLDGVKASKNHLKNMLVHEEFNKALAQALKTAYYLNRNLIPREAGNFFLGACSFSDEVSFILNNKWNYYDNHLMKIATVLAGTVSAEMTFQFQPHKIKKEGTLITAFDARPIVLNDAEHVRQHLEYRWLIARRNTMSKALRLEAPIADGEIYGTDLQKDLGRLSQLVDHYGLGRQVDGALSTFKLWKPDRERVLISHSLSGEQDFLLTRLGFILKACSVPRAPLDYSARAQRALRF